MDITKHGLDAASVRARRQDANHAEIRELFRKHGGSWFDTHALGRGFPDGVVGYGGLVLAVEVKNPKKPPSQRKLTPKEQKFHAQWTGCIRVVENEEDVKLVMQTLKNWQRYITEGIAREMKCHG